jgi:hypothetical protein
MTAKPHPGHGRPQIMATIDAMTSRGAKLSVISLAGYFIAHSKRRTAIAPAWDKHAIWRFAA